MIPRIAASTLQRLARGFPVIALTGPRQSGKTTLAKAVFVDKTYVSLENPDEREFAERDPRRFLLRFDNGAILDEVQRCPALLSWLQGLVDERGRMGDFNSNRVCAVRFNIGHDPIAGGPGWAG